MIVSYNVCDQCSTQTRIEEKNGGVELEFFCNPLAREYKKDIFPAKRRVTFCDKECMIEFLKAHINNSGEIK